MIAKYTAENKMAEDSEKMFVWGDDFDAIWKMKLLIIILHQLLKK